MNLINSKGVLALLRVWCNKLAKAESKIAQDFFNLAVFPLWDWFNSPASRDILFSDEIRFEFWYLLPYSFNQFPKAVNSAVERSPQNFLHVRSFARNLLKTNYASSYPDKYVNLLLSYVQFVDKPEYMKKEWKLLWESIKDSGATKLNELQEILARNDLI